MGHIVTKVCPSRKDGHQFGESSKKTPIASHSICGSEARLAEEPLIKAGGETVHVQTKITAGHQFYLQIAMRGSFMAFCLLLFSVYLTS